MSISREELGGLPIESFDKKIVLVTTVEQAEEAVNYLQQFAAIGFDTETRPSFQKGVSYKISLMQFSTDEVCFLFRLNRIGFPDCLTTLLVNPSVKKIGLSLKDDLMAIHKRKEVTPNNFFDLQPFVKNYGIDENGLQKIYALLFDKKITKRQRLTNWDADVLTDAQMKYAALDAWACLRIFNKLTEI